MSVPASAYEVITHARIVTGAINKSEIVDAGNNKVILERIGAKPVLRFPQYTDPTSGYGSGEFSVLGLLANGVIDEDDAPRFLNHFFEPVTGGKLEVPVSNETSPDWAIDGKGQSDDFSWKAAREAFFDALTSEDDEVIRKDLYGKTFKALGQVLHHIGDMAQPQHVRLDEHCKYLWSCGTRYNPSRYELFTDTINVLLYGGYDPVIAPTPRDYWNNAQGFGLADYTRNNFVSAGTNFQSERYVREFGHVPPQGSNRTEPISNFMSPDEMEQYGLNETCLIAGSCVMTFVSSSVEDKLKGEIETNNYAATYSIFTQDLNLYDTGAIVGYDNHNDPIYTQEVYTLNQINFAAAHQYLIPRAVGYSAGLINYFFRGKFEITPPDNGVYAVVDHAQTKTKDVEGFKKIKLNLRNVTADIEWNGGTYKQNMENGELVLVAKYKKNECYQENLTGEFNYDTNVTWVGGCSYYSYRSSEEYIVKSRIKQDFSITADSDKESDPMQLEFTFDEPIPINAVDLVLQVVFKGKLGEEDNAVVVSTVDIYEPTYYAFFNGTDYKLTEDREFVEQIGYNEEGRISERLESWNFRNNKIYINGHSEPMFTVDNIEPGDYIRFSYLTDKRNIRNKMTMELYWHFWDKKYVDYALEGTAFSKTNQSTYYPNGEEPVLGNTAYPWRVTSKVLDYHFRSAVGKVRSNSYQWYMMYFYRSDLDEDLSTAEFLNLVETLPPGPHSNPMPLTKAN